MKYVTRFRQLLKFRTSVATLLLVVWLIGCDRDPDAGKFGGPRPTTGQSSGSVEGDSDDRVVGAPSSAMMQPLRVCVIDDPVLADTIQREWQAHSQQAIELQQSTASEIGPKPTPADVLIFPSALLGQLVSERQIIPWPENLQPGGEVIDDTTPADDASPSSENESVSVALANYDWGDVFASLRLHELRWGRQLFGVSFGSPELVLMYRKDLFDRWDLAVPRTWEDYANTHLSIQTRLAEGGDSNPVTFATLEPQGEGWSARLLLARAASYARHPNQYSTLFSFASMEPLIDREPFVRALKEQQAAFAAQPADVLQWTPHDVTARFLLGESAMAISWPSSRPRGSGPSLEDAAAPVTTASRPSPTEATFAFAELPGSRDVYQMSSRTWQRRSEVTSIPLLGVSGRIGAVGRQVRSLDSATSFLMWLTSREQASRVSARSRDTTLFRTSLAANGHQWVEPALSSGGSQYGQIIAADQSRTNVFTMLRLPLQDRYVQTLDDAVRQALTDERPAQEALSQAADNWRKLNRSQGQERAKQFYLQSLGL